MTETYFTKSSREKDTNNFVVYVDNYSWYVNFLDTQTIKNVFYNRKIVDYQMFNNSGIYVLYGIDKDDNVSVYVGQSTHIIERLNDHLSNKDKKGIWDIKGFNIKGALCVVNDTLTQEQLDYSENQMIKFVARDIANIDNSILSMSDSDFYNKVPITNRKQDIKDTTTIKIDIAAKIKCDEFIDKFKEYISNTFSTHFSLVERINDFKCLHKDNTDNTQVNDIYDDWSIEQSDLKTNTVIDYGRTSTGNHIIIFTYNNQLVTIEKSSSKLLLFSTVCFFIYESDKFCDSINKDGFRAYNNEERKTYVKRKDNIDDDIGNNYYNIVDNYYCRYNKDGKTDMGNKMKAILYSVGIDITNIS